MMAIHRTPAPTPSAALPSCTSENAKTSTQETAKNSVVYAISRLRTSTVRSLRTMSQTARSVVISCSSSDDTPICRPEPLGLGDGFGDASIAQEDGSIEEPFGQIQVVG